ncbi:MAG: hypothetical protein IMW92_01290 [Bacillales bacterium]|nr:hypothetical protein [Bacillales bacterium]
MRSKTKLFIILRMMKGESDLFSTSILPKGGKTIFEDTIFSLLKEKRKIRWRARE